MISPDLRVGLPEGELVGRRRQARARGAWRDGQNRKRRIANRWAFLLTIEPMLGNRIFTEVEPTFFGALTGPNAAIYIGALPSPFTPEGAYRRTAAPSGTASRY
jgi:hypothetical protein